MPVPIIIGIAWGITKIVAVAGIAKGAIWGSARLVQHGFDITETKAHLRKDVAVGKLLARDAANLIKSLRLLKRSKSLHEIIDSAIAISVALDHLPTEMRAGLNTSTNLENYIEHYLEAALKVAALSTLLEKPDDMSVLSYLSKLPN